ncbi:MAG TPA: ATP-binding cassette domain-containing protein [Gemmatimonadales bacterium]|jgi:ABC-2 type transport system ATP-binding protein|nr:ATP-binding cassette domain-containing protein [Gemmatimonadales bacterium]
MTTAVSVERITKRFAGHTAVRDLSFAVPAGGIFGLLGPNGAGKSTTIRMIMDIIEPDEGRIALFGTATSSRDLSERVGFLPEERGLYREMKVLDHLTFLGEVKGLRSAEARTRAVKWLERLGLSDWSLKKVEDLSKGMQQKIQFAGTLIHDPDLVILDEPFSGLDPVNLQVMKDVVVEIARSGRTVLFSTHIMEQAERMCDRIVIIARGEKVVDGAVSEVKAGFGEHHIALTFAGNKEAASRILADRQLVAKVDDYGASAEVSLAAGASAQTLLATLVQANVELKRFEVVEPSLQSIFIAKVGDASHAPARAEAA